MTQKPSSDEQDRELSWEEAVARYLEDNPDYFERYPDALAALNVRHADAGGALSLIERQVRVLRDQKLGVSQQLRELLSIARENDVLAERLHRFALAMIDSAALDDVLGTARDMLRQQFKLDVVVILLKAGSGRLAGRSEFVDPHDHRFDELLRLIRGADAAGFATGVSKPVCGASHGVDTMSYLFAAQASQIHSTAMVAMAATEVQAIMCLGSADPQRFHPHMGTIYLSRFGELLMAGITRRL